MVEDPAYVKNLKKITRRDPDPLHLEEIEKELYVGDSDRATAILFGSFVEVTLERLLISVMRNDLNSKDRKSLFEYEGAVGSFSSKTVMAYALKLIGPVSRADLDLVRLLRNEFAHSRIPFNFTTPEVKAVCDQFQTVDLPGSIIPFGYLDRASHEDLHIASDKTAAKTRFISTCHNLSYRMLVKRDGNPANDAAFAHSDPLP